MPDTEAMAERARIVAWLRQDACRLFCEESYDLDEFQFSAFVIERGDHDYIAIPRLSGDQGAK